MKIGIVFPGQGSQSVGMLNEIASQYPVIQNTFKEASDAVGKDLWKLVSEGPEDEINQTENTQPIMLSAGVALWRLWLEKGGIKPAVMAGHSLGEYSALVCAGSMDFADAVVLVTERGRYMQEAVPEGEGGMAAILGMDDDIVARVCELAINDTDDVVAPVNFNAPGQVVIAGHVAAVKRAVTEATMVGAKRAVSLPISVPSHCALMHPAADKMKARLADTKVSAPGIPVLHNVSVESYNDDEAIRQALVNQVESPVMWTHTIRKMVAEWEVEALVEIGPGKVLTGLNKRISRGLPAYPVYDSTTLDTAVAAVGG